MMPNSPIVPKHGPKAIDPGVRMVAYLLLTLAAELLCGLSFALWAWLR